ncbi:MAE_28990/MAE_18760 family HEPN-like nuclease [Pantoea sp. XY16]|uniref:MAE_28990/MAE_18760 family HEPN-like nuclease n=1 Tax=Pantoea sp. XY16 TaxID=2976705 RepID=UPI0021A61A8F|nr:MAE_28990/MAE_18760 family HEPN-like nuclease [Pantoea sp. XY16]MCT2419513.1 MAE_28990/MAE_18760 family HEPN-like nuclease [Pantoea sp. XY16]
MIKTKEDLIDKIATDHIWRLREMNEMKNLIETDKASFLQKQVLCRAGIALMYAHWEGFVKKTGTYFLEYVSNQRHSINELKSNFITLIVKGRIDSAHDSKKYSAFDEVTKYILSNQQSRARIPIKNVVDTQSNLSTTVLKEILWCLGLDYVPFESKEKLIDQKLVNRRNHIAHGQEIQIEVDDFAEMMEEVLGLMTTFRNMLENCTITEGYKAA